MHKNEVLFMKKKYCGMIAMLLTMALAAGGALLRRRLLTSVLDENGLLPTGNHLPLIMAIVLALGLVAVGVLLYFLEKRPEYDKNFAPSAYRQSNVLALMGSAIVVAACAMQWNGTETTVSKLTCIFGILGGALLLGYEFLQMRGTKPNFLLLLPMCVFLALKLIGDYQQWSGDSMVLDYCYMLLADATCMLAIFNLGGFSFDRGKRRATAFWCSCGIVFSLVSVIDGVVAENIPEYLYRVAMIAILIPAEAQLCDLLPRATKEPESTSTEE